MQVQWISKDEAAGILNVTEKRIRQLVSQQTIKGRRVAVSAEDKARGVYRPVLLIDAGSVEAYRAKSALERQTGSPGLANQILTLRKELAAHTPAAVPALPAATPSTDEWLTMEEAEAHCGGKLPAAAIGELIGAGELYGLSVRLKRRRNPSYLIRRSELDGFRGVKMQAKETGLAGGFV